MVTIAPPDVATIPARMVGFYLQAVVNGINGDPTVMAHRQTRPGGFIVLCSLTSRGTRKFVTWYVGDFGAVSGNFFDNEADAREDFRAR